MSVKFEELAIASTFGIVEWRLKVTDSVATGNSHFYLDFSPLVLTAKFSPAAVAADEEQSSDRLLSYVTSKSVENSELFLHRRGRLIALAKVAKDTLYVSSLDADLLQRFLGALLDRYTASAYLEKSPNSPQQRGKGRETVSLHSGHGTLELPQNRAFQVDDLWVSQTIGGLREDRRAERSKPRNTQLSKARGQKEYGESLILSWGQKGGFFRKVFARIMNHAWTRVFQAATNVREILYPSRSLDEKQLRKFFDQMLLKLTSKNVAQSVASHLVDHVKISLGLLLDGGLSSNGPGTVVLGQERVSVPRSRVKAAVSDALKSILSPETLSNSLSAKGRSADGRAGGSLVNCVDRAMKAKQVYVMVVMGVNGVGKSTTLAKIAYYLQKTLQPRILVAACDTFRAGAVEQLKTHVQALNRAQSPVTLFDKGYGLEPHFVAAKALEFAERNSIDVVLIDTAGRMQNNKPLMKAIAKLLQTVKPHLTLFVAEALAGHDALNQLRAFNDMAGDAAAPQKMAASAVATGEERGSVDGIVLTKFDAVDDMIGSALNMAFESKRPIYFVGTGQTYADLQTLDIHNIADVLLP